MELHVPWCGEVWIEPAVQVSGIVMLQARPASSDKSPAQRSARDTDCFQKVSGSYTSPHGLLDFVTLSGRLYLGCQLFSRLLNTTGDLF
jgi:hypothetical protein